ncbi:MAG: glycosyltransferase family 4 protein [Candidatus Kariarchaeaceae archaeon]|jgi:glycosyltransferase involved in cell wall biosynthesis
MKILLVSSFFPPTHTAGTEKRTLGYALELNRLGHEVQVVCAGLWNIGDKYWNGISDEIYLDIPVRRIHLNWVLAPNPNEYLFRNPVVAQELKTWLQDWHPDIVHITSCYTLTASIIQLINDFSLPIVLTLTDYWFICPKHTLLRSDNTLCDGRTTNQECLDCMLSGNQTYRSMKPLLKNRASDTAIEWVSRNPRLSNLRGMRGMALDMGDRKEYLNKMIAIPEVVVAPSQYLRDTIEASGITRQIRVIHSGHDLSWIATNKKSSSNSGIRFGYIGQITPIKGVHILLSAFSAKLFDGQATVSIYGNYNNESAYTDQLMETSKGRENSILFHGEFPHDQLGNVLSEIDVLIVPSVWQENNPRVIQEAFASKTPVVASSVGGITEFVKHEVNGLLFERGNEDDLSRQMYRFINEPDLIQRLRTGISPVKKIENEVEELLEIYEELTNAELSEGPDARGR